MWRKALSLSVALWIIIVPLKAKAQTNDPPPSGSCYVFSPLSSSIVEYSRRGMIVWEITPTSAIDYDFTPWGLEENFVVIVGWTDFMEGEEVVLKLGLTYHGFILSWSEG